MIKAKQVYHNRGFGGDNWKFQTFDGTVIEVSIGWGLLQPCEAGIRVPSTGQVYTVKGDCEITKEGLLKILGYEIET